MDHPLPVSTEVLGYRFWRVGRDRHGPSLWSVVTRHCWHDATVGPADIDATGGPWTPHKQGLYAFSEERSLDARHAGGLVSGMVRVWGRVAVHETGYRAERARVVALFRPAWCILCPNPAVTAVQTIPIGPGYVLCERHSVRRWTGESVDSVLDALASRYGVHIYDRERRAA